MKKFAKLAGNLAKVAIGLSVASSAARSQDQVRNFGEPILVLNTGGHHAAIRSLIVSADERTMLSAGEDKVVRVWDLATSPPTLTRTIRPPIFRGPAGEIFAMALSPPDPQGQSLAVAGFGVQSSRGDIGIYRYPGAADQPQGEIERWIAAGRASEGVQAKGHTDLVYDLKYAPKGRTLASASNDGTVRLWGPDGALLATLHDAVLSPMNRVAFTPDGARVVTASRDGFLRIFNVAGGAPIARAAPFEANRRNAGGVSINALAVSPDGRWVVIGSEDGYLVRYDLRAADLAASAARLPTEPRQSAVEAVAFAPDGRLATAINSQRLRAASERPDPSCDVELRRMPDGAVVERVASASNTPPNPMTDPVYALTVSPKGTYLVSGGGNYEEIDLKRLDVPNQPLIRLAGRGAGVWDVGFVKDAPGLALAYSDTPPRRRRPPTYHGFDLADRTPTTYPAADVGGAQLTYNKWTVQPVRADLLNIMSNGEKQFEVALTSLEGRWWAYSFLPPGPGHNIPALAVACKYGVVIHRLSDGVRTRFLDGHSGPVRCLAPSPDGKFLATGSADQTVRLWRLAGCDVLAPLGAEFVRRGNVVVVAKVEPRSFAEGAGFAVGDEVVSFRLGGKPVESDVIFLEKYPTWPPNSAIEVKVRRKPADGQDPNAPRIEANVGTTKRDAPLLSLFVGREHEWVLWMPKGYYDSSVAGDSDYLGWHLNRATIDKPSPSDYVPLLTYERELRQVRGDAGNVIDRLLATADDGAALAAAPPPPDVAVETPPTIAASAGAGGAAIRDRDGRAIAAGAPLPERITIDEGNPLAIEWTIAPQAGGRLGTFAARFDGELERPPAIPPLDPAGAEAKASSRFVLEPGLHKVRADAANDKGMTRQTYLDVEVVPRPVPKPKPEPPTPPRLVLLAIAPEFEEGGLPAIPHAATDAEDLAQFFAKHLVAETSGTAFPSAAADKTLIGPKASAEAIAKAVDDAAGLPLKRGDLVVVVVESHVLGGAVIAASDSRAGAPKTMVSADALAAKLGSLARRGCKVVVLTDGLHGVKGSADLTDWARTLRNQEMVTTFLASNRPTDLTSGQNRVFTRAILNAIEAKGPKRDVPLMTLSDFRRAVLDAVPSLSALKQEAACYIPKGIDGRFPFLNPKP